MYSPDNRNSLEN